MGNGNFDWWTAVYVGLVVVVIQLVIELVKYIRGRKRK